MAPHRAPRAAMDDSGDDLVTNMRNVRLSDNHLLHLALEAAQAMDWQALSSPPSDTWTLLERPSRPLVRRSRAKGAAPTTSPRTRILTREEIDSRFAVLAHTTVSCSLIELIPMLEASTSVQFSDVMRTIHGDAFVAAELVHHVATDKSLSSNTSSSGLLVKALRLDTSKPHHDSSKESSNVVSKFLSRSRRQPNSSIEEWIYIDYVQRISAKVVRKTTLFTLDATQLAANGTDRNTEASEGTERAGYLFEELDDGRSTRVTFWGEHVSSQQQRRSVLALASRSGPSWLLRTAETIDRFVLVVRRRRLGLQVMVDQIKVQASNTSCIGCDKSFLLSRKRVCDLCGYNVCSKCSQMEDRERRCSDGDALLAGSPQVRICDKCLTRVDQCDFRHASLGDLSSPMIYADPSPTSSSSSTSSKGRVSPVTTGKILGDSLQGMLQNAPATKTESVLGVIKHLVGHKKSSSPPLTASSTKQQYFDALTSALSDPSLPLSECKLAERSYLVHHSDDPDVSPANPVPASEVRRVEIIRSGELTSLEDIDELNIILALVSKELKCIGALISIAEADSIHVLATNIDFIPAQSIFPRNEGFCSTTIMSVDPLLVPHPEADMRFNYIAPVKQLNVGFYCGYPLFADDFTVLGSLCCLSFETCRLTQSQFTVGKKLAEAASRILQHHIKLREANRTNRSSLEDIPEESS